MNGVQVRWFGDPDHLTPWAMLHDLPDGTIVRHIADSPVEHVANRRLGNRPVLVVAWPDGSVPQPPKRRPMDPPTPDELAEIISRPRMTKANTATR